MTINDAVRVRVIRAMLGMSSRAFAARLDVCAGTLTAWERGRSTPQGVNKQTLAEVCQEHGIGFLPCGYPFPMNDCMTLKPEEKQQ